MEAKKQDVERDEVAEKVLENRMRRALKRRGMRLVKSKRRDPKAFDFGGYMIINAENNTVVCGTDPMAFSLSLDNVAQYVDEE